jgi:hypothetical protein
MVTLSSFRDAVVMRALWINGHASFVISGAQHR